LNNAFILIHSPLVGLLTWSLVANEMRARGLDVIAPALEDSFDSKEPFWKQHADSVARALAPIPTETSLTLVAHSGAGPLLPAIRQSLVNPVHAYVFVDAGIARDGLSRLDLMKSEDPAWAEQFQEELARGERFPTWSFDDLQEVLPKEELRRQMVAELQPRGLDFFTEPIPVFDGWPDAPCIYIQCSAAYEQPAGQARKAGWLTYTLEAGHFHMLVDPAAVTDSILEALDSLS
jgi:pimeloyl-ACP methyl ester carboxylesterase